MNIDTENENLENTVDTTSEVKADDKSADATEERSEDKDSSCCGCCS